MFNDSFANAVKTSESVQDSVKESSVLLVDDILPVILRYKQFLRRQLPAHWVISFATSGPQALEMMKKQRYSVVFMDLDMPSMRGEDCLQHLREWEKEIGYPCRQRVIALFDEDHSEFKQHLVSLGFDGVELKSEYKKNLMKTITRRVGELVQFDGRQESVLCDPMDHLFAQIDKLQTKDVLVVDDCRLIRNVYTTCLEQMGLTVQTANDGKEALELMKEKKFLAVFMDIAMPDMDGVECITQLRDYEENVGMRQFVTAVTACANEKDKCDKKHQLITFGFDGAVAKASPTMMDFMQPIRNTL